MKAASDREEKLEKILQILDNLSSESGKGVPIIVEGKRDVKALSELKITGDIIAVKTKGKNLLEVLNEVESRGKDEAIVLTDFDRQGREMMNYLRQCLEEMKIKPNVTFWKELSGLLRKDIKDVEGLSAYIETLKRKIGKG